MRNLFLFFYFSFILYRYFVVGNITSTDRGGGRRGNSRRTNLGQRRTAAFGAKFRHGVLGLIGSLFAFLEIVLHLAIFSQVDRCNLFLYTNTNTFSRS